MELDRLRAKASRLRVLLGTQLGVTLTNSMADSVYFIHSGIDPALRLWPCCVLRDENVVVKRS